MEYSAGAIIFYDDKKQGIIKYLLLYSIGLKGKGYWGFPKGHIEEGEEPTATARREIMEETNIDELEFILGFLQKERYFFRQDNKMIYKQVLFFLAKSKSQQVKLSFEHSDFIWLPFEQAIKKVSFSSAKQMLKKAHKFLLKGQSLF